ncbi:CatA-like O-acetyltransferase [Pseudoteredinibacter isoporae]|uniref:CatA-like O-acetyltransferase n=1 Tax=Pseudoteredinibacter isoporae TaxID=570281 RepID=UPI0031082091
MKIDLATWSRREHFEFYREFQEPYWGCCVDLEISKLLQRSKEQGFSFTAALLFAATKAANQIDNLRYRLVGDDVIAFDTVHISNVFMRANTLFSFGYVEYRNDFQQHCNDFAKKQEHARKATQIFMDEESGQANALHFSALPWLNFSSMSHARAFSASEGCPKISIGKISEQTKTKTLPFSVHVHHGFVDGYHMSQYLDALQDLLNQPDWAIPA